MAQVAPELMTFTVQVPDNAPPGALVQFTAPNGQSVQAQIPPGLGPGAQFTIAVPAAVQQQHGPDTAVGVVEEGGLQGVLRGLDGVVYFPRKDMLAGQDFTVHATDQVVDRRLRARPRHVRRRQRGQAAPPRVPRRHHTWMR